MPWLSFLILIPAIAGIALLLSPGLTSSAARIFALFASAVTFGYSLVVFWDFDRTISGPQMVERYDWIADAGLEWSLRMDGVSLWMMMLTTVLFLLAFVAGPSFFLPEQTAAQYLGLVLLAEAALLGVWLSGNLLLFYVFWEAMLIPFYFLVGVWGSEGRGRAVIRFVIYTMVGSLLMLVAIVATGIYAQRITGQFTLDIEALRGVLFTEEQSRWLFAAFAFAFAIKLPLWPFHAWLPDTYRTAPIMVTGLLAAVMSKAGAFGFLVIGIPLFPQGVSFWQTTLVILSVISIIYGSLVAWRAPTMRLLVAYSSIAHLGFIALGIVAISSQAGQGAVLQMINHGIVVAAAFAIVGILTGRTHREGVDDLGGLANGAPWLAGIFLIVTMASLAIPGSNAFAGEFFILTGAFTHYPWAVAFACLGIAYASVYMLRLYQRTMNGPAGPADGRTVEMRGIDWAYLLPLVVLMAVIALWPQGVIRTTGPTVEHAIAPAQVFLDRPADRLIAPVTFNPPEEALPLPGDQEPFPAADPNAGATP